MGRGAVKTSRAIIGPANKDKPPTSARARGMKRADCCNDIGARITPDAVCTPGQRLEIKPVARTDPAQSFTFATRLFVRYRQANCQRTSLPSDEFTHQDELG